MATLSITIPDAVAPRVMDAVASIYGYLDPETGLPRVPGQTKAQFAKETVKTFLKNVVKQHEAQQQSEAARQAALNSVESEINLS